MTRPIGRVTLIVSDDEGSVIQNQADVVIQAAELLAVSVDELLGLRGAGGSGIQNRRLNRRLAAIEKLDKRDQEALLRTIDAFVSKAG